MYVPPGLTFRNSIFCPQCIYVFLMDFRTVIISVYSINLSIFITKTVFTARYRQGLYMRQIVSSSKV